MTNMGNLVFQRQQRPWEELRRQFILHLLKFYMNLQIFITFTPPPLLRNLIHGSKSNNHLLYIFHNITDMINPWSHGTWPTIHLSLFYGKYCEAVNKNAGFRAKFSCSSPDCTTNSAFSGKSLTVPCACFLICKREVIPDLT